MDSNRLRASLTGIWHWDQSEPLLTSAWNCDVCLVNELHREKKAGKEERWPDGTLGSWPLPGPGAA